MTNEEISRFFSTTRAFIQQDELEDMHVLFMTNDRNRYIDKLFTRLRGMVK